MKKKLSKTLKQIMVATLITTGVLVIGTLLYMRQDKFGKNPSGTRLERIKQSPNFKNGKFHNVSETPTFTEGYNYLDVIYKNYIKYKPKHHPTDTIPSVKTDLLHLPVDTNVLVWFGHSSYFMQIDGKRILVDPVFTFCNVHNSHYSISIIQEYNLELFHKLQ